MSFSDLDGLVLAGDVDRVQAECVAASERKGFKSEAAGSLLELCRRVLKTRSWVSDEFSVETHQAAALVGTLLLPIGELTKHRFLPMPSDSDATLQLLSARTRSDRNRWVVHAVETARGVALARRLVFEGSADRPDGPAFTLALIDQPGSFDLSGTDAPRTIADVVRSNPDLVEDEVWRLFEVEGTRERSLAAVDKYAKGGSTWHAAFVELAGDGTLDRDRLLDASLDALMRGFAQFRAQWYSALHEGLEPTPAERAARWRTYLGLASSPVGPTASMALRALVAVQRETDLDAFEVINGIGPALAVRAKGSAKNAIRVLCTAIAANPGYTDDGALVLAEALCHPSRDVQQAAADQLLRLVPEPNMELHEAVSAHGEACHPSVRAALETWLGNKHESLADISAAYEPRSAPAIGDVDWLDPSKALRPLEGHNDLLEAATSALERPVDTDQLEAVMSALAVADRIELRSNRPYATLGRRAAKLAARSRAGEAQHLIARVLTAALTPQLLPSTDSDYRWKVLWGYSLGRDPSVEQLFAHRINAVAATLASDHTGELLAAPTHTHGVLDPVAFAERLARSPSPAHPAELAVALLRLAPDRDRLHDAAETLTGTGPLGWVRSWLSGWADFTAQDVGRPVGWTFSETSHTHENRTYRHYRLATDARQSLGPELDSPDLECVRPGPVFLTNDLGAVRWLSLAIPALPGAWAQIGARAIGANYGAQDQIHGLPGVLDRFFDPTCPLEDDAHFLLALALADPRDPLRVAAVDLCATAIDDGRLKPDSLGMHIGELASTGVVTARRYGRALGEIAHATENGPSAIHSCAAIALAQARPTKPQELLSMIELLEELHLRGHWPLPANTTTALQELQGTNRTAQAAARLLALTAPDPA